MILSISNYDITRLYEHRVNMRYIDSSLLYEVTCIIDSLVFLMMDRVSS